MNNVRRYINFRYLNWLDYATQMAKVHHFIGWEHDLLSESVVQLFRKPEAQIIGLLDRKTKKIVNGEPTTELDKYILSIMKTNAFSASGPFRKNVLGKKIIRRRCDGVDTCQLVEFTDYDDIEQSDREQPTKNKLDVMHRLNISRLKANFFDDQAIELYTVHYVYSRPLGEFLKEEQRLIAEISAFLKSTQNSLFDN